MRVLFIGLGSIGKRHCHNFADVLTEKGKSFSFSALRVKGEPLGDDLKRLIDDEYYSWEKLPTFFDVIFITNPTYLHYETLLRISNMSPRVFIEKPVFSEWDVSLDLMKFPTDSVHYVAAPLRYTRVFQYLMKYFNEVRIPIHAVRGICSSYLPDWRPGTDYRKCHSAFKEQGGDVGLELIHEWDYLTLLFGMPESVRYIGRKVSDLEITSDDIAVYIANYPNMVMSIWLDYFGYQPRREVEFYVSNDVIVGDFIRHEIRFLSTGKTVSLEEDRDTYQKEELRYFLSLKNDKENGNTIEHAIKVMKLAKGIV